MSALFQRAAVSDNAYTYTFKGPISGLALDCALTLQAGVKAAGGISLRPTSRNTDLQSARQAFGAEASAKGKPASQQCLIDNPL